ncbi:MAG TPA: ATP-binding cassette domain-containing protein, partial [Candidatus Polarisedimenticolia bacterium]|nr:ATP-binding cassette domain-containing protein [Candidatus Polarisedimenticolia bacterium]
HYALFHHMTVGENIEFSLRVRKVTAVERRRRRDELLELVGLVGFHGRFPRQLSGGQQQRVALARALAHRPQVLLLDEPFGALDAKIRADLRRTVRAIQRELGVATIFVTHDQEEAFELADRLGVMHHGRLLEAGVPEDLYLRPQTEFVATFLGTANLMVGERTSRGVRLGTVEIPLGTQTPEDGEPRRVQVLFRPEDVAVKDSPEALEWPLLSKAVVEESEFVGPVERLRLRLPPIAGVRPISPPPPYGGDYLRIDASRSQHQARRYPMRPGDVIWVGVRRVHALTHPGLSFLLTTDGTPKSEAALALGGKIARLAHARVLLLVQGTLDRPAEERLRAFKEKIGAGLVVEESRAAADTADETLASEAARGHYDLVVRSLPEDGRGEAAEQLLLMADHHVLLVPAPREIPTRVLVCVAVGEPGKDCVRFAARLLRHVGASVTLMTVVAEDGGEKELARAERFLAAGAKTMSPMQVPATTAVKKGEVVEEVEREMGSGGHDMLVVGTPPPERGTWTGRGGIVPRLLDRIGDRPILIVRSQIAAPRQ